MPRINLLVTSNVLNLVSEGRIEQCQIAIRRPSAEIRADLAQARASEPVHLHLGGLIPMVVGDTPAIWRVHQPDPVDFDRLFELLGRRPGHEMTFACDLA